MSRGVPSAEMTGSLAFQLPSVSIGMVIRFAIYVTQVDSGETLVVGSNDQIAEQGGVSDES